MIIQLGWAAPTIASQFPDMCPNDAMHFQRDHQDLSRLKIRGIISDGEHKKALNRFAKKVLASLTDTGGKADG